MRTKEMDIKYGVFVNHAAGGIILLCYNLRDAWDGMEQNNPYYWLTYNNMVPQYYSIYFESEHYEQCWDYIDKLSRDCDYDFYVDDYANWIIIEGYNQIPNDDFAEVVR